MSLKESKGILVMVVSLVGIPLFISAIMKQTGIHGREVSVTVSDVNRLCINGSCVKEVLFEAKGSRRSLIFESSSNIEVGDEIQVRQACTGKGGLKCKYSKTETGVDA